MLDDLNIRELYNKILEERVIANGHVLLENLNIPSKNSSPDSIHFDGNSFDYDQNAEAFSFIGKNGLIVKTELTHPYIFNALKAGLQNPQKLKKIFKDYNVEVCGKISQDDLVYFYDKQKEGAMGQTRINTFSGRIWKSVPSKSSNKNVSVIAFWNRQKDISENILKKLKECFGVRDLFWIGSDSKNYNYDGDTYTTGDVKELRSKIAPELGHDDIVDILMRAHTGYRITPFEKKIVWEFRGVDPSEWNRVTGGYPSVAEYEYRKKLSEGYEEPI